ncbi:MAG: lytic murein transglycosylase, partial [Nocardioidaceae bacterium]
MSADLRLKLLFAVTLLMAAALATGVVPVAAQTPDASTTSATSPTTPTTPSTTTTAPETPTTPTTPTIPTTPATPTTPIAPTTPRQAPPTRTTEQSPGRKATGRPRARKAPKAKVKREGRGRAKRRRAREKPPERCLRLGEWKRWRHELLAEGRRREAEKLELCKRDRRKRDHGKARKEDRLAPVAPSRNTDGSPTPANPGFMDALPGPSSADGVPNFVIRKFRVPIFLLPIYQAAGIEYGIRWELLAAINEIETDYGRNLGVSSAGAVGWMQFLPSSWALYGVDGNEDGRRDPYNPVDAIFSAARYLKAAGYEDDVRGAIFAYNHADWYVDSVLLRARLIAGMPSELVGSLTGLTEGRFPVTEHATYADDIEERDVVKRVGPGENAANVIESSPNRRSIRIFSRPGAPVVAVNDGVIKRVDETPELGRFIVLEDVYGNRYTYAHLGEVASLYPGPSEETGHTARTARAIAANPPAD